MTWVLHTPVYPVWVLLGSLRILFYKIKNIFSFSIHRYGSPYDGYLVANQTLHGMLWLAQYEFAMPERESKLGTLMWPEW
jgi:hypothetical protein